MPTYESPEDRERQDRLAWILEYVGFEVKQTRTSAHYDFSLKRNGLPYAVVEYKKRHEPLRDPYYIDIAKVDYLIGLAGKYGVKPILIVEPPTTPYLWTYVHSGYETHTFTRTKGARGDKPDVVYQIPLADFREI